MVLVSGIAVVDLIASGLAKVAAPGELVFGSVKIALGGHACNVSVDLVRLGFPPSEIQVVFPAGRDVFGRFLVDTLREQGLRAEAVLAEGVPTSLDLILVAKGEDRRYHVDPGANIVMPADRVLALLEKCRPRLFYAGGTGLLNKLDAQLHAVLKKARAGGAMTFVDVVSPYKQSWAYLRKALPQTDFFHCNDDEAAALTGERNPAKAVERICGLGARHVFLTMGERGVLALVPGALIHVPAFRVRVTDPTGAGDAFSAGLILKIHERASLGPGFGDLGPAEWERTLLYASACGAVCCGGVGTTTAVSGGRAEALVRRSGQALSRLIKTTPPRCLRRRASAKA